MKRFLKYLTTIIILVVSIWWALRGIDLEQLKVSLLSVDYTFFFLSLPVILFSHWLRAVRWKTMLKPIMKVSSTWNLFSAVMIGYAANNIFVRAGEFLRPYVYSKREKVSFSSLFATIIVERVLDVLFLMLLFLAGFILLRERIIDILPSEINPTAIAFLAVLFVTIVLVSFYPPIFEFILRSVVKPLSNKFYVRLTELFEKFKKGLEIIKTPSQYLRLIIESGSIWLFYALPMYIIFFAFPFQSTLDLGIGDAIMLTIVAGVGVTIAPSPGAIGVYHALIQTALVQLYNMDKETALAYATVAHLAAKVVEIGVGGLFFLRENVKGMPSSADMQENNSHT